MDFEELSEILRMVHSTDIVELELKSKKFSLSVKKKEALEQPEPVYAQAPPQMWQPQMQQQMQQPGPPPQAPQSSTPPPSQEKAPEPKPAGDAGGDSGYKVTSPMAGTFYRSPAPGEAVFVKEGDRVTSGQTVCIIEAMKLMNEIEADVSGSVVKWLVENGTSVTPGQPLLTIAQ
eukprot:jgi/Astpho2/406/Aster-03456